MNPNSKAKRERNRPAAKRAPGMGANDIRVTRLQGALPR
jgi:hypothetical protein